MKVQENKCDSSNLPTLKFKKKKKTHNKKCFSFVLYGIIGRKKVKFTFCYWGIAIESGMKEEILFIHIQITLSIISFVCIKDFY